MSKHLQEYLDCYCSWNKNCNPQSPLFTFDGKRSINPGTVSITFHQLMPKLHLVIPPGISYPRLHCLRHSFAVGTLLKWYRSGVDPTQQLIHLSTFLGHVDPTTTAIYLKMTPELLEVANEKFEKFSASLLKGGIKDE